MALDRDESRRSNHRQSKRRLLLTRPQGTQKGVVQGTKDGVGYFIPEDGGDDLLLGLRVK